VFFNTLSQCHSILSPECPNENKHEQLTLQVQKNYTVVRITGRIPPGCSKAIDLSNITLGRSPDGTHESTAGVWTGFEFLGTGILAMPFLVQALTSVGRIVDELSAM
jgi:hypothetical protein